MRRPVYFTMSTGENLQLGTILEIMKYSKFSMVVSQIHQVWDGSIVDLKGSIIKLEFQQISRLT